LKSVAEILEAVKTGRLSVSKAEKILKLDAVAIVGDVAHLDFNRHLRRGIPEIVYAESKTSAQISSIVSKLATKKDGAGKSDVPIILSRVRPDQFRVVSRSINRSPRLKNKFIVENFREARMIAIRHRKVAVPKKVEGKVVLLAAGTSDAAALNEAEVVLQLLGCETMRYIDVGVAALHRLVEPLRKMADFDPDAVIVAAGMEGALASVIAGVSSVPVIGLPTSVGYGYGRGGEAALMSMLQACPLGMSVVNIDGGVAAGVVAWMIAKRKRKPTPDSLR